VCKAKGWEVGLDAAFRSNRVERAGRGLAHLEVDLEDANETAKAAQERLEALTLAAAHGAPSAETALKKVQAEREGALIRVSRLRRALDRARRRYTAEIARMERDAVRRRWRVVRQMLGRRNKLGKEVEIEANCLFSKLQELFRVGENAFHTAPEVASNFTGSPLDSERIASAFLQSLSDLASRKPEMCLKDFARKIEDGSAYLLGFAPRQTRGRKK
jgi:hypothetical protein